VELRTPLKAVIFVPQAEPPLQNQQLVCALPTPIKIDRHLPLLQGYVVKVVLMLFEGFTYGFPIHFEGGHTSFFSKNLISAKQNPGVGGAKLAKEIVGGRIVGPSPPPFSISVFLLWGLCLRRFQPSFDLFTTYLFHEGRPSMTAFRLNTLLFLIVVWMMQLPL
jgi:hypothetical protein